MGWEAIERYLYETEQEFQHSDQQVPQMLADGQEIMQQTSDLYTDEFIYNKPVLVSDNITQTTTREESSDIFDLDQAEKTFYPSENYYTNYNCKLSPADIGTYCGQTSDYSTKSEHLAGYNTREVIKTENFTGYSQGIKPEPLTGYNFSDCSIKNEPSQYLDLTRRHCASSESDTLCSEDNLESLMNVCLNYCSRDVDEACKLMNISPDPRNWSPDDVRQWIMFQCEECRVETPNLDHFYMPGTTLCNMTEDKFELFAPEAGSVLYKGLVYWRNVVEQEMSRTYQSLTPPQPISYIPVPRSPGIPSSPDSVCSNPSMLSDTESQSSPSQHNLPALSDDDDDRLPEEPINHHRQTIQLWQFLKLLLLDDGFTKIICWLDRSRGIFKIINSSKVAKLWGKRKNRPAMNYDKLSRSIRQYYKKGIIKKTESSKRLVYQFCSM